MEIKYGIYEVRPTSYLNIKGKKGDPAIVQRDGCYDIVKWEECDPTEVTNGITGEKETITKHCYVIATLNWTGGKDPYFKFESCGNRFLEACIDNEIDYKNHVEWNELCKWIIKVAEMLELDYSMRECAED